MQELETYIGGFLATMMMGIITMILCIILLIDLDFGTSVPITVALTLFAMGYTWHHAIRRYR